MRPAGHPGQRFVCALLVERLAAAGGEPARRRECNAKGLVDAAGRIGRPPCQLARRARTDGRFIGALAEALRAPLLTLDEKLAQSAGHRARVELLR